MDNVRKTKRDFEALGEQQQGESAATLQAEGAVRGKGMIRVPGELKPRRRNCQA
jgi:hypothetical protein